MKKKCHANKLISPMSWDGLIYFFKQSSICASRDECIIRDTIKEWIELGLIEEIILSEKTLYQIQPMAVVNRL